ncbi:hypothetical protein BDV26DRAFT_32064 [Aspergillus bertholletiae]|uniref:F-box domain-containing protein n=1 Tax=Aspergillus bertholletiae TaxID=1226010 RepID=A0A5N7AYN4_9EURO|nr:hypothetical protein BDV26DRAFT_32064 [Aspergillus bertholletiae]
MPLSSEPGVEFTPAPLVVVLDVWYMIIDILCDAEDEDQNESRMFAKCAPCLKDLISLSSTCTWLRNLLAPRIFAVLYLRNRAKSALSIKAIADGNFAGCVKELRYIADCEPGQLRSPLEDVYPPEVDTVLSSLAMFTSLRTLSVDFPFDYDDFIDYFETPGFNPDHDAAMIEEAKNTWLGLITASYRAILSSYSPDHYPAGQIPLSLNIRELHIVPISVFSTDEFHKFLSKLRSFNMSLTQWDNGVGWMLNTQDVFFGFSDCLGPWFFNHLTSVEEFTFDPQYSAPLGDAGQPYAYDISLWKASMPRLRELTLGNIYLCPELKDFLLRHLDTLESISLRECYSCNERGAMSWSELLSALAQKSPTRLTSFSLDWDSTQEDLLYLDDRGADPVLMAQVRTILETKPNTGMIPFGYCYVSDKYGYSSHDSEANRAAMVQGDDFRSYQALMAIVNLNATQPSLYLNRNSMVQ